MRTRTSYRDFLLRHYDLFVFALILVLGGFLLFSNLSAAIYMTEDEARPFQLLSSGQLIYLLSAPLHFLHTQASVFYFVAFLNFLSLIIFYLLCRASIGRLAALFAAALYAVYPLRIDYARTFYPAAFMEVFFLTSVLCCYWALSRRRTWWMSWAGAFGACLFFIHYMGWALIAGILSAALFYCLAHRGVFSPRQTVGLFLKFILGAAAASIIITQVLSQCYGYDFFARMAGMYGSLPSSAAGTAQYLLGMGPWLFVLLAVIFFMVVFFLKIKDNAFGFFLILYLTAALLFCLPAFLGKYWVFERHFIWFISFYCLGTGAAVAYFMRSFGMKVRAACILIFLAWAGVCAFKSYEIMRETFQITPMIQWLKERGIPKEQVLTFWKLREPTDIKGTSYIPAYLEKKNYVLSSAGPKLRILWPYVYKGYLAGRCRYLITSGIDDQRFLVGEGEPLLVAIRPLVSWPHPYSQFSHRSFYRPGTTVEIKLYDLKDVFSQKELFPKSVI